MKVASELISVTINGEKRAVPPGISVIALLGHLKINGDRVAIERNLEILPRAAWAATQVGAGDRFEIVQFVGGG